MAKHIVIGTRGSDLALWQANFVAQQLRNAGAEVVLNIIKTQGDKIQHIGFDKMEGKGFFTKELEEALLNKEVDLAVHSCKDLETVQPNGLCIAAYAEQEDPRDLLLVRPQMARMTNGWPLKQQAVVGTSSARRKCELLAHRPDLEIRDLRGNVPTRVGKLKEGLYDAIVLAKAGLDRLEIDLSEFVAYAFPASEFIPAAAQGVLALQTRDDDNILKNMLGTIWPQNQDNPVFIERHVLNRFEGGCQVPLGVHVQGERLLVSWAPERNALPRRIAVPVKDASTERVIEFMKGYAGSHRVFVSTDLGPGILETTLKAFQVAFHSRSLIRIQPMQVNEHKAEWIFLSSSNALKALQLSGYPLQNHRIAALGKGTAQRVFDAGHVAEFVGKGGDTSNIASAFLAQCNPESVFLPQSNIASGKVEKVLKQGSVLTTQVCYQTQLDPVELDPFDTYVFTSPSNVAAFMACNTPASHAVAVAIGPTTASALATWPGSVIECDEPSDFGLADGVALALFELWKADQ